MHRLNVFKSRHAAEAYAVALAHEMVEMGLPKQRPAFKRDVAGARQALSTVLDNNPDWPRDLARRMDEHARRTIGVAETKRYPEEPEDDGGIGGAL